MIKSKNNTVLASEKLFEYEQIKQAQENISAFSVIYKKYYKQVFLFVFSRVDSESEAADLCSETFMKAMKNIKKYKFQGLFIKSWLLKIAINEINMHYRNSDKNKVIHIDPENFKNLSHEIDVNYTDHHITLLKEVLNKLNEWELEFINLKYFENRRIKEIAVILDLSESNTKVKSFRLTKKMNTLFHELLNDEDE